MGGPSREAVVIPHILFLFQEQLLLEPMFEVPGSSITSVHINEDVVAGKCPPKYEYSVDTQGADRITQTTSDDAVESGMKTSVV